MPSASLMLAVAAAILSLIIPDGQHSDRQAAARQSVDSTAASRETAELDLAEIIRRHTVARGGAAAVGRVRSVESLGWITEPTFKVQGHYCATIDHLVRVDVYSDGKRVFSEGVDTKGPWEWRGDTPAANAGSEAGGRALRHTAEFQVIPLHEYHRYGHVLSLSGREQLDGVDYYVIAVTLADGFHTNFYVDPRSWMITRRRDARAYHVDVDSTKKQIESRFSDFRAVGGVLVPFRTEEMDLRTGSVVGESVLIWRKHNGVSAARMDRGASMQQAPTGVE